MIRGERIDGAPLNVRTPILRLPMWLALAWWTVKGLARLVVLACRYWYVTGPAPFCCGCTLEFGWSGPVGLVGGLVAVVGGWAAAAPARRSCRFGLVSRCCALVRAWSYRRRWTPAMATARLAVAVRRPHRAAGPAEGALRGRAATC